MKLEIWRVRTISVDGGRLGKVWEEEFFTSPAEAHKNKQERVESQVGIRPTKFVTEKVDGVVGEVNWNYGTMIAVDRVLVVNLEARLT